jgi:hypothetical protein
MPTSQQETFWDVIARTEGGQRMLDEERARLERAAAILLPLQSPTSADERYRYTGIRQPAPMPRKD